MKILTVEDDPIAAIALDALLKSLGHEVLAATNGEEAMEIFQREPVRMVVSDWQMRGGSGLDLCRNIRAMPGDYTYFILVTQMEATDHNGREAMRAGVDDFLTKPVRTRDLRMRLHVAERIIAYTQQVKHLESILPICSYCRKVRDDENYWEQIERYLSKRTGSRFSHSVCPECYESRVRPEYERLGIAIDDYPAPARPRR